MDGFNCPICLQAIYSRNSGGNLSTHLISLFLTNCGHIFHSKCMIEWKRTNNTCPMCRLVLKNERSLNRQRPKTIRRQRSRTFQNPSHLRRIFSRFVNFFM